MKSPWPPAGQNAPSTVLRLPPLGRIAGVVCAIALATLVADLDVGGEALAPGHVARTPFTGAAPAALAEALPVFSESWISPSRHTPSVHSSSICTLPSGDLLAIWYGGSREGAGDVALYTARLPLGTGQWSAPARTMDPEVAQRELQRVIKKVGNAVLFADRAGRLWMVYVSVSVGGWSGSALNVRTSMDEGRTWSRSERLTINPFLNLSTLVRNKPIFAGDGRIGLPVYHELAAKFPQILWLQPGMEGRLEDYRVRSLPAQMGLIQPVLVPLDGPRVLMLLRDRGPGRILHTALSQDNGWTWSDPQRSNLPNPDAALDALRLRDGRILIVYNHASQGRGNLRLALSGDDGQTWQAGTVLEEEAREEFSYPTLTEDQRGRIHLTYTWRRQRIRHVSFNLAWLDARLFAREADRP